MTIPTKSFQQITTDMVATWGSNLGITPVLNQGDFVLALFETVGSQLEFLQAQTLLVLQLTRAATSTGPDLDTWMADFSFTRLPATNAFGPVTFGLLQTSSAPVYVQAATLVNGVYTGGVLVQTVGGAVVFQVIPDTTQPSYSTQSNSYVIPAGGTSVTATVQAVTPGTLGNVAASAISQIASQSSVNTVTNLVPFTNGYAAESDSAFRARFVLYLQTLAKATGAAIQAAAQSVQQGVSVTLAENQNAAGAVQLGSFTCYVSDGAATPTAAILAQVYAAVYATRAFCVAPYVVPTTQQAATISVTVRLAANYTLSQVQGPVASAIAAAAAGLLSGQTLYISAVEVAALSVAGVVAVQSGTTTISGVSADLVPTANVVISVSASAVAVGQY